MSLLAGSIDTPLDAHTHDESQNVSNDDCEPSFPNLSLENVSNGQSMQCAEDEQVVEDVMQSDHASDAEDEHVGSDTDEHSNSDWSATERGKLKCEQTAREILAGNYKIDTHPSPPLEFPTSSEDTMDAEDTDKYRKSRGKSIHILANASEGSDVAPEDGLEGSGTWHVHTQEAQAIADEYGKTLESIMAAAGLTMKATWAESVWNMHQAWYAGANPKTSDENLKDYYCHQMKHYEDHKDKEQFPGLWAEIHKFWSESVSGKKDMSSKAMVGQLMTCRDSFTQAVQTWCNVENFHVFGCVIYIGNDEAACQAQGIFAGSSLCMQLASERQMDVTRLLDYLTTIIKYKHLDSTATVPLPAFAMLPGTSYDHTLLLKPQESRHDRIGLSPETVAEEVEITHGQKNVPWRTLLDLPFAHKYIIFDWPSGVPAVSRNFNIKCLNANELGALTVPFLKEQMGNDYHMEATAEDKDDHTNYVVPVPAVSFSLKPWTADQHALVHMMDLKAFDIPLAFLKMIPRGMHHEDAEEDRQSAATPTPSSHLAESSQEPPA
ncbi:hypothetical protein EDC04DRAFT_2889818 [Pisolithus marmoratus]|nr:hypothetical protein EDC04DRAFT_2889818 [Pisolithus marmoratus]